MGMILPKMLEILAILWFSEFFYRKIQKFFGAWDLKKRHEIKSGYNFFKATKSIKIKLCKILCFIFFFLLLFQYFYPLKIYKISFILYSNFSQFYFSEQQIVTKMPYFIEKRIKNLFKDGKGADVKFLVGPEGGRKKVKNEIV